MNLMKLFNYNYFKQNMKKSKSVLVFLTFSFMIINLIYFITFASNNDITVFDVSNFGAITAIFMYIIPICLSITLFSYVFRKKSVDFINSMPIDRKTIFVTNSIGGIILMVGLLLINIIVMGIIIAIIPNLYIPYQVFIDYILLFSISYIFMFMISNIAVSVSGNIITSVIVTLLILLFIPVISMMFNNVIVDGANVFVGNIKHYYTSVNYYNYTLPVNLLLASFDFNYDFDFYSSIVIIKMVAISIIYFIIGMYAFCNRKMEVCETTFRKYSLHQFVKLLTIIPFLFLYFFEVLNSYNFDLFVALIFITFIVIYIFVYDLITKKEISNIIYNLGTTALTFIIIFLISLCVNEFNISNNYVINDIDSLELSLNDFDFHIYRDEFVKITDKDDIRTILSINDEFDPDKDGYYPMNVKINIGNNAYIMCPDYDEEERKIIRDIVYNTYKDEIDKYYNDSFMASVSHPSIKLDDYGLDLLKKALRSDYDFDDNDFVYKTLTLYIYRDHKVLSFDIKSNINEKLNKYIIDYCNEIGLDVLSSINYDDIDSLYIENAFNSNYNISINSDNYGENRDKLLNNVRNTKLDYSKLVYGVNFRYNNNYYEIYTNLDENSDFLEKYNY